MALCIFLQWPPVCLLSKSCVDESVKELQRKRHSATPGVSIRGRVRKVAKWQTGDQMSDEESDSKFLILKFCFFPVSIMPFTFNWVIWCWQ